MEAFGPVMLHLLLAEEEEERERKQRKHIRRAAVQRPKDKVLPVRKPPVHGRRRTPKPRVFRERTGLEVFTEEEIIQRYRLNKSAINELYELIKGDIDPLTQRSHAIPGMVKLLNCLHFFASGSFQTRTSSIGGVSQSAFSRFMGPVIDSIKKHLKAFIYFPKDKAGWQRVKRGFYRISGMPHVMGVLDCMHIALSPPHEREELYRNSKGFHSVSVQVICDSKGKILSIYSAFPGSSQESVILKQTSVYDAFKNGKLRGGWLVGGPGYTCHPWLLTPVKKPTTTAEHSYNEAHTRIRSVIERTFSLLKSQFKCLDKPGGVLQYNPTKVADIIVVCCILHNIGIQHNIVENFACETYNDVYELKASLAVEPELGDKPLAVRGRIITDYFSGHSS
ncbi:putative nuclease HARBI1 [Xenopus laevis]|uniref:Putative nuclease HARBI1 n=1 Tax=Xenopus laevis TaxID=8355 RepID=A0A8J0U8B3_XENLA|nr:putative nuclease HARBI1 [Xenopus laevis]XP_018102867.1 putative nuclease HARBI1 [Xenopus laevis]XP_041438425.1 putative nuclease HARBI1 [Xenopus laevis]